MDLIILACAGVIVFGVMVYVILDGFDLGVGILFAAERDPVRRDTMVASIAPVWDGNETWLILGGAVLFGAFPLAYAIALPAFYIPIMAMLFALIFRGVAFEFRAKATNKRLWDRIFLTGSAVAALAQGLALGGLIEGVTVKDGQFAGGPFDWLGPISIPAALGVLFGYGLLGATWLILKTEGELQKRARRWAFVLTLAVLAAIGVVSLVTPISHPSIAERWFGGWETMLLLPIPVATGLFALLLIQGLRKRWERMPFLCAIGMFLTGYLGLAISLYPYIVPHGLSIWDAAAPRESQIFVLVAVAIFLPMTIVYTWYAYRVFRGKVRAEDGYGH